MIQENIITSVHVSSLSHTGLLSMISPHFYQIHQRNNSHLQAVNRFNSG